MKCLLNWVCIKEKGQLTTQASKILGATIYLGAMVT